MCKVPVFGPPHQDISEGDDTKYIHEKDQDHAHGDIPDLVFPRPREYQQQEKQLVKLFQSGATGNDLNVGTIKIQGIIVTIVNKTKNIFQAPA